MTVTILRGHCLDVLRSLPAESVQGVVTSPPYFQLRSYGTEPQVWGGDPSHEHEWTPQGQRTNTVPRDHAGAYGFADTRGTEPHRAGTVLASSMGGLCPCGAWKGELGQEPTPALYVEHLVSVFRECWRVLKNDGVLLLNIADSYAGSGKGPSNSLQPDASQIGPSAAKKRNPAQFANGQAPTVWTPIARGFKAKDLYGIPWRVAFALQDEGWYLRGDYIWAKPACMTESVKDRCTRSHEYVFHLTKRRRYFWNQDAIRNPQDPAQREHNVKYAKVYDVHSGKVGNKQPGNTNNLGIHSRPGSEEGANARSVWTIATAGFDGPHFAGFPPALAERMVLAVSRPGDTVLDPFLGAGTTALEADRHGRDCVGIELNEGYAALAESRIRQDAPLFAGVRVA